MVGLAATLLASTTFQVSPVSLLLGLLSAVASIVTIGGAFLFVRSQRKDSHLRNDRFDRDWYGEPERPGVAARPGVMEQLSSLRSQVAVVHNEVIYNHGGSIKDVVEHVKTRLETVVDDVSTRLEIVEGDVKGIHKLLDERLPPHVHS